MRLYNTLTRKIDTLNPQKPPHVTVYTCGPTVYDYAHIGHWFTYLRWDTLVRTLKVSGLQPIWVMNITDVGHLVSDADEGEDKLEKGAKREGKTAWQVAEKYTSDFLDGMQQLGITTPDVLPKATQHIPEQIELIKQLETRGYTYIINDGVYYDTKKFPKYNKLAQLDLDEQQAGARVQLNPEKRNATDFALWKFSPAGAKRDMEWNSPWGKGFPGWHIECSAMAMKYLGETLDIHAGGIDHLPVHHTNEIAQSEPITGKQLANIWLHSNHLMINGEKIAKSAGNGIRLEEIIARGFSPTVLRLHVLESHYRSQSKFTWESLEAAQNRLNGYRRLADLQFQAKAIKPWLIVCDFLPNILKAVQNDLNTPAALAELSNLATQAEERLISKLELKDFKALLKTVDDLFGLGLSERTTITHKQRRLITEREIARTISNWKVSDELRDELAAQGILLRDTEHGTIWHKS